MVMCDNELADTLTLVPFLFLPSASSITLHFSHDIHPNLRDVIIYHAARRFMTQFMEHERRESGDR